MLNINANSKKFFEILKARPNIKYCYWTYTEHRNHEWRLVSGGVFPLNHVYEEVLNDAIGCTFIYETSIDLTWEETISKLQEEQEKGV